MHEIVENIFMRATKFMHDSGLRVDEDHVDKQQDLSLVVGGWVQEMGSLGLPDAVI